MYHKQIGCLFQNWAINDNCPTLFFFGRSCHLYRLLAFYLSPSSQGQDAHVKEGQKGHPGNPLVGGHDSVRDGVTGKPDHPRIAPVHQGIRLVAIEGRLDDGPRQRALNHEFPKDIKGGHEEDRIAEEIHSTNLCHDIPRFGTGKESFPTPVDDGVLGTSLIDESKGSKQEGSLSVPRRHAAAFKDDLSEEICRKGINSGDEDRRHEWVSFQ
jgi:hypothetical protein